MRGGGVQNQTNPLGKPQTEPIETENDKNLIWFGCIWIIFDSTTWFGLVFVFYFSN